MKDNWQKAYEEMLKEIERCKQGHRERQAVLECCFRVSSRATKKLITEAEAAGFENESQEIEFFREVKPRFVSEVLLAQYLYHIDLFEPTAVSEKKEFWRRESERLTRFRSDHESFCRYYGSDDKSRDEEFFTTREEKEIIPGLLYLQDDRGGSKGDGLAATLLALQKFDQYVRERMIETEINNSH
jgi:hypothetical protein